MGYLMTLDPAYIEKNRLSAGRIRSLAGRLTDEQMQRPVGARL